MLAQIALWLCVDLLLVSLGEYVAHRWFMHAKFLPAFHVPHWLHHYGFYRRFNYEPDPQGRELNLRIGWLDTLLACLLVLPLAHFSPVGYGILFALALLHRWTWNAIHAEMHLNEGRWFAGLRVYQLLREWHFLHHRHPGRNFNVTLPLMDLLFGTRAQATRADWVEWQRVKGGDA